jgi:hypothetical protein
VSGYSVSMCVEINGHNKGTNCLIFLLVGVCMFINGKSSCWNVFLHTVKCVGRNRKRETSATIAKKQLQAKMRGMIVIAVHYHWPL